MSYFGLINSFSDKQVIIKDYVNANLDSCGDNSITVSFPEKQKRDYKKAVAFALVDFHNKYIWYRDYDKIEDTMTVDFEGLDFVNPDYKIGKFKLYLVFEEDDKLILARLFSNKVKKKYKKVNSLRYLYYDVIAEKEKYIEAHNIYKDYSLLTNITTNGLFGFIIIPTEKLLTYRFQNYINSYKITEDEIIVDFRLRKYSDASEMGIKLRSYFLDENFNKIIYDIDSEIVKETDKIIFYRCKMKRDSFSSTAGDIFTPVSYYIVDGKEYFVHFKFKTTDQMNKLKKKCDKDTLEKNVSPSYISPRVGSKKNLEFYTLFPINYVEKSSEIKNTRDFVFSPEANATRGIPGEYSIDSNGKYLLSFAFNTKDIKDVVFFAFNKNTKERIILDTEKESENSYSIDFSNMKESMTQDFTARSYMLCTSFEYKDKLYVAKILSREKSISFIGEKNFKDNIPEFKNEITSFETEDGVIVSAVALYSMYGYLYVKTGERSVLSKNYITVPYVNYNLNKRYLEVTVDITDAEFDFNRFVLSYRYKKSEDRQVYYISGTKSVKNGKTLLTGKFDLTKYDIKRVIWDVFVVFNVNNKEYFASISATDKQTYDNLYRKRSVIVRNDFRFKTEDGTDVFLPYFTMSNSLAFMVRELGEMDSRFFKFKEYTALAINKVFGKYLYNKKIMLTYEKYCNCAQDNGSVFFKHCMKDNVEEKLDAKIYYIIDKKAPDYERVKKYKKNVIDFLSLKHMVYILGSRLLVSSDSRNHIYAWRPNCSPILRKVKEKKYMFLQHGVTALKRVDFMYGKGKSSEVDMFVTTSQDEFKIVTKIFGYEPENVCVTGFARWDDLVDKSEGSRAILLMPTWRSWLDEATDADFLQSDYYKNYTELLNSGRLNNILNSNDLTLQFYIHPKFKDYIDNFQIKNDRIKIIPYGSEPLNELMMKCKLLITDYSSVCWDVFYMNKPVLFYQFDYDMYNTIHGSYIDMENDLFGDRSLTLDKLFDDLEASIKNKFELTAEYSTMRDSSYAYIDRYNSSRIVKVIKGMDW